MKKKNVIMICVAAVLTSALLIVGGIIAINKKPAKTASEKPKEKPEVELSQSELFDIDDPQSTIVQEEENAEAGAEVDISEVVDDGRTGDVVLGIDVSKYQGIIDWKKVAESGIEFAMIRVGYRTLVDGNLYADSNAKYNMQEAQKYGIKVGVYFFSTAISKEEAVEEANWVANYIAKYQVTYPVAYDCEGFKQYENRHYSLNAFERTDIAVAFLERIKEHGYDTMFYASKSDMEDEPQWDVDRISSLYKVWIAQYPALPYPQTPSSSYYGPHAMWQYTSKGTVPGIKGSVDMNVAYFSYGTSEVPKDQEPSTDVGVEDTMVFREVNETVTAKEITNLRDKPSLGEDSTVVHALLNGETATRIGISDSGWARVIYNGQTLYCVSSYLKVVETSEEAPIE